MPEPETVCPVCGGEVVVEDGVYPIHYRSTLYRCDGSGQPAEDVPDVQEAPADPVEPPAVEKPIKKAAPRKKAPAKKAPAKK